MTTQDQAPGMDAIKERMHKVWTSGEYARIGNPLVLIGELLCEGVDLRSGDKVLDVATGSGNTAISAARRFCEVTGMDLAPESIEHARRRAAAEGMDITFAVGDAEDLSYPDASFDVVLSTIGVMFCPNQEQAAAELLRVCRPGARSGSPAGPPKDSPGACSAPSESTSRRPPALSRPPCGVPKSGYENFSGKGFPHWRRGV